MSMGMAFGKALREARMREGMSQEALAHEAGLDRTYISMLERGKRQPTIATLFSLAQVLRIKPSVLVRRVEKLLILIGIKPTR